VSVPPLSALNEGQYGEDNTSVYQTEKSLSLDGVEGCELKRRVHISVESALSPLARHICSGISASLQAAG